MTDDTYRSRFVLKTNAKANLRNKYGPALCVAAVAQLIGAGFQGLAGSLISFSGPFPAIFRSIRMSRFQRIYEPELIDDAEINLRKISEFAASHLPLIITAVIAVISITLLYRILVGHVVTIGKRRWFLRASQPDVSPPIGFMFSSFRKGQYSGIVGGALWKSVWLFVWSLPVIILNILMITPVVLLLDAYVRTDAVLISPELVARVTEAYHLPSFVFSLTALLISFVLLICFSIILLVKSYQYRMADYILADNASIGAKRALELSKKMAKGNLWRFFVLDLSFAGWFILAALCICLPGIAIYLLLPYYEAVWAEAYKQVRDDLAARRECTMEELGYVRIY